jgi:hypothetical protein
VYLDPFLEVDRTDIKSEYIAAESGDVLQKHRSVEYSYREMHNHAPKPDPGQKREIRYSLRIDDWQINSSHDLTHY